MAEAPDRAPAPMLRPVKIIYEYFALYSSLTLLGLICLNWSLSVTGSYRLDLCEIDSLRGGPPVILAPNHPCLIDALLILTRHPNIVCVMKSALMRNVLLGSGSRRVR